jgi:hypothetical protein
MPDATVCFAETSKMLLLAGRLAAVHENNLSLG